MRAPEHKVGGRYRLAPGEAPAGAPATHAAYDEREGREVVLEVYPLPGGPDAAALAERLRHEAAALAAAGGRCLPAVYGFDHVDGHFLVAREPVAGEPLAEALRPGAPRPEAARLIAWAVELLGDLATLHGAPPALAHGRIAPEALVVDGAGRLRLLGCRLGHGCDAAPEPPPRDDPYAAPERVLGALPDRRGDLYSLGAVLVHALAGRPPAPAAARAERAALQKPDPLQLAELLPPELPPALGAALERALALRPRDRFQSAEELREALAAAVQPERGPEIDERGPEIDERGPKIDERGPEIDERGPEIDERPPRRRPALGGLALSVVALGAGALLWAMLGAGPAPPPGPGPALNPTTAPRLAVLHSASLDGPVSSVAFLPGTGRIAAGLGSGRLALLDEALGPLGGQDLGAPVNGVAAGDGGLLAVALQRGAGAVQLARGADLAGLAPLPAGDAVAPARAVAIAPGGGLLAAGGDGQALVAQPLDGPGAPTALVDPAAQGRVGTVVGLGFLGAERLVSASAERGGGVRVWSGPSWAVEARMPLPAGSVVTALAVDPPRGVVVAATRGAALHLWPLGQGGPVRELPLGDATVFSLDISPDGGLLAVGMDNGRAALYAIAAGELRPVPWSAGAEHGGRAVRAVRFSGDGRLLATADDGGAVRLWAVPGP